MMPRSASGIHYFRWLVQQIHIPDGWPRWDLFSELHRKQFTWSVPNDDNRVVDALELRHEYLRSDRTEDADTAAVSVLEVLIALSRHISFDADGDAKVWAWQLVENLTLHRDKFLDPLYSAELTEIDARLDALIWRQYEANGLGGFFPLGHPTEDQTKVEIWYQMSAYLEERHPEYG